MTHNTFRFLSDNDGESQRAFMVDFHIDKPTLRPCMCHAIEQMREEIVCLMSYNAVLVPDARRVSHIIA
jgi:hypothetical protein